ncbi:MAG: DNA cytosine methyltransferase [Deltaproteobacteria bacterium]|nr:DNA cytosine methyltransferase [Deltaproteobacteria bacterium]
MAKPTVISLFSGAGGLDYGFEAAGFQTAVAVEMDRACCITLRANRRWPVVERDIFAVPSDELLETARLRKGEASVLIGGPPCQPFSKAGYWSRGDALRLLDPRANTLGAYLRVLEDVRPHAFLLENVEGLAYRGKDEGLKMFLDAIEGINRRARTKYRPVVQVVNAADYGVPQLRKRLLILGARDGTRFTFPAPTHGEAQLSLLGNVAPRRTAWDAIGDLAIGSDEDLALGGRWAELLPSIPEGNNYLWHTSRMGGMPLFGWRRRYWSFLLKLAKTQPSWTIQAQPGPASGPFHWDNRHLSMRELCRLQTFPDNVRIVGSRNVVQKQVGNAVPSLLAEVFARAIRTQLLGLRLPRGPLKLLPVVCIPPPAAEEPAPVPRKYWALRGDHAAHPGRGQGNSAALRGAQ